MFVLTFLVLAGWIGVAFCNERFKNQFRFYGWMKIALFPLALAGFAKLFFDVHFVVTGLPITNLAITLILAVFCFFNIKKLGVVLVTIGFFFNTLAMTVNGGYMPVDSQVYRKYTENLANLSSHAVFMTDTTRLSLLGDWLYFPYAGGVFSPGDILVFLGLLVLVIQYQNTKDSG